MYVCMYVCMYVYMYVCMYVCINIYNTYICIIYIYTLNEVTAVSNPINRN